MKTIKTAAAILVCLVGLTACASMNQPIGDSFGVAVENNKQAQIVNKAPASDEQPTHSGARAAEAIERYQAGPPITSETTDKSTASGS